VAGTRNILDVVLSDVSYDESHTHQIFAVYSYKLKRCFVNPVILLLCHESVGHMTSSVQTQRHLVIRVCGYAGN